MKRVWNIILITIVPLIAGVGLAISLHHWIYPAATTTRPHRNHQGPVTLRVKLPGTHAGIPEPLVVCGVPGRATMAYIRLLPENRARVGIEFWGLELNEGTAFPIAAADETIDVRFEMPGLYAEDKTPATYAAFESQSERKYSITVGGVVRLEGKVDYSMPVNAPLYFGVNPLGGSFVSSKFTGTILLVLKDH